MSIRKLAAAAISRPAMGLTTGISPMALDRWNSALRAVNDEQADRSIGIYDAIGKDWWTGEGVTAKRVAAALRSLGPGDVTVNINSPGGDMFEGLAIYNLLREHDGHVTVKVVGIAASAAADVAMAGDTIQVARAGFMMIHNGWVIALGNRNELRDVADWLEPFDAVAADIYASRSGQDVKAVAKMMDAETWLGGAAAIDKGFADEFLPSDQVTSDNTAANQSAVRRVECALRSAGMPRNAAQKLISEFKSSLRDAAGSGVREATEHGRSDSAIKTTAALAASLTTVL